MLQLAFKKNLLIFCLVCAACVADLTAAEFKLGDQGYLTISRERLEVAPWEGDPPVYGIELHGKIFQGDFNKFLQAVAKAPDEYNRWSIALYSPGGDILEAMRIGRFLRKGLFRAGLQGFNTDCASACFLIWIAAVERSSWIDHNNKIGIHRPRYEETHFASLSADEASKAYDLLDASVREYLSDMGVPTHWIDKMFAIPSNEIYWLSPRETKELGGRPAFFDEWIRAKCPGELSQNYSCVESALFTERKDARRIVENAAAQASSENSRR